MCIRQLPERADSLLIDRRTLKHLGDPRGSKADARVAADELDSDVNRHFGSGCCRRAASFRS